MSHLLKAALDPQRKAQADAADAAHAALLGALAHKAAQPRDVSQRAGYVAETAAELVTRADDGRASVMLAGLRILADYRADGNDISIVNLVIVGREVGAEWFDADTLKLWQTEIAKSRADDLRTAREAAEASAWLERSL